MIKRKERESAIIEIDLTGAAGNVYYLLGCARKLAPQINVDYQKIESEMKSSDYVNAVIVFDEHFGEMVALLAGEQLFNEIECRKQQNASNG